MTTKRLLSSTALTVAVLGFVAPALAQTAGLEEIVVTARKTNEKLQEVPIAIAAYTSKELEERGTNDVFKIAQFTPGFSFEKVNRYGVQGGGSRPVIRGMSNILGDGNAAVFVDGILYSDSILSFPFDVVDRVEIIKGPQSALFGRSTFSGAIAITTKKGSNKFENEVSATAAEYDNYEVNLLSRGPLIEDKLFYMGHARYYTLGSQYKNTIDGKGVGQEESYGGDASLEFRASDALTLTLNGGYNEDHDGMAAVYIQDRFSNNCFLNAPRQYYCGEVKQGEAVTLDRAGLRGTEGLNRHSTRLSGQIVYDANDFIITSNTGAFWTGETYGYDSTYQGVSALAPRTVPGLTQTRNVADPAYLGSSLRNEVSTRNEWSTELRVQSPSTDRLRLLGGAFYYKKSRPLEERHFLSAAPTVAPTTYFGTDRVNNWAVFGSVNFDITDKWTASAELRYAQDKVGNYNPISRPASALIERKFNSTTPRFSTNYKVTSETMLYATIAKGNKPGYFNSDPRLPVAIQFANEESSWNYEIGAKNTFFDGKLIANASLYYIDWKNQQLTDAIPIAGTTVSYVRNAGKTHVKGFELELQAVLTEHLTGGLSYALTDAKFVEFFDTEAGQLFGNTSVAGKQLPNQPKNQASVFGKVTVPLASEFDGFFRADLAYNDRKFDQIYNLAYGGRQYLLNLRMGIETEKWNLTFFVDNALDDRTPSTIVRYVDQLNIPFNTTPGATAVTTTTQRAFQYPLADKRRFGVTGKYKF